MMNNWQNTADEKIIEQYLNGLEVPKDELTPIERMTLFSWRNICLTISVPMKQDCPPRCGAWQKPWAPRSSITIITSPS